MSEKNSENIIPEHQSGVASNTESAVKLNSVIEAKDFYAKAKQRLLHVNGWQHIAGAATAVFQLADKEGKEVDRTVQTGDHFKIDIPGPGSVTGEGFDWVQVEAIEENNNEEEQSITIRVRPTSNPTNEKKDVAHFFSDEATSSFVVKRQQATVIAGVYGRNEKPNTKTESIVDKARNAAIATGAITGLAKLQWKSLVNGLVKKD